MSTPDRQELIRNAVAFLQDPKVGRPLDGMPFLHLNLAETLDSAVFAHTTSTISGGKRSYADRNRPRHQAIFHESNFGSISGLIYI
jgi:hypothetical protein